MFREYHKDLIKKCSHNLVEQLQRELDEVLQDGNYVSALQEITEAKEKAMYKKYNYEKDNLVAKFNPTGLSRYIDYKTWFESFNNFILSKEIPDLIKLRQLHKSVEGDAFTTLCLQLDCFRCRRS